LLQGFAVSLFSAFLKALLNPAVLDTNSKDMVLAIELLLQLAPSSLWAEPLHTSGLFAHFIHTLDADKVGPHAVPSSSCETDGPPPTRLKKSTQLLTALIYVLARIAIADAQAFIQLMSLSAQTLKQPETYFWEVLLDQWWNRVAYPLFLLLLVG
jgi:hypothetical protein